MATTITMPQLGETVTEGTVAQWLKNVGDRVEKYEAFVEVSTDKVNAEVPSPVSGVIRELIVGAGQTVSTGAAIAIIDEVGVSISAPQSASASEARRLHGNGSTRDTRFSPAVRRLVREHGVDSAQIRGTGTRGRVTAADVLAIASPDRTTPFVPAVEAAPSAARESIDSAHRPGRRDPLSPARKLIAQRMVESKRTAPHAWTMVEVDVTNLWAWRTREKAAFERDTGVKLTLLPFFMRAVVESLQVFPVMNASFGEDGILVHAHVNIGIAIAVEDGLLVPVIRNAGTLSIRGLASAAGALIDKARRRKLVADDLSGGTFTVNNTGANGAIMTAPILVRGQAGIVTMEAVVKRPVVRRDDAIAIRSIMNVCLSLDHRVVDGAIASGFLVDLKTRLEGMGPSGAL